MFICPHSSSYNEICHPHQRTDQSCASTYVHSCQRFLYVSAAVSPFIHSHLRRRVHTSHSCICCPFPHFPLLFSFSLAVRISEGQPDEHREKDRKKEREQKNNVPIDYSRIASLSPLLIRLGPSVCPSASFSWYSSVCAVPCVSASTSVGIFVFASICWSLRA